MADAANGGTEGVLVKEELALEGVVEGIEGGVTEKVDAVGESVEESGVGESLNIPDGDGLVAAVEGKEVTVESEAVETAPIPVEDGKGVEILDPVVVEAGGESSGTAYAVVKELEEPPKVPPAVVDQEEIPESTGNPGAQALFHRLHGGAAADYSMSSVALKRNEVQPLKEEELAIKSILDLGKSYTMSVLQLGKQGDLHLPKLKKINRQMIRK